MAIIKMFFRCMDKLVICVVICEYHFGIIITEVKDL